MAKKKKLKNAEVVEQMFECIRTAFSERTHNVKQFHDEFDITGPKGEFVIKAFTKESIKGSSEEVRAQLEELVRRNTDKNIPMGFIFLRCNTDYAAKKNAGAFLKQSWDRDRNTREEDNFNVKKVTKMEIAIERLYNLGADTQGYKSRLIYFNPKTGRLEAIRLRENSPQHRISNTIGYMCDRRCILKDPIRKYKPGEQIDFSRCKTEKKCTLYARGRNKREIRGANLNPPVRMEVQEHTTPEGKTLYLARLV
jgi:hypothetical protein